MNELFSMLVPIVIIGGPVLAWVIRVEKKLAELCTMLNLIYNNIEKRHNSILKDSNAAV